MTEDRGDSATISIVLMIGIVAVVSVGVLLVAGQTISTFEQEAEAERVEAAFIEFSHSMETASANGDATTEMDLTVEDGSAIAMKDTGWIRIESAALNESEEINVSIGTVQYEGEDGSVIAYQAGGVFSETGENTELVSPPEIDYHASDETLTLPVITVSGEQELDGKIRMRHNRTTTYTEHRIIENETVHITIQSDFYRGWEEYFEHEAGSGIVRNVDEENRIVEVELEPIEIQEAFDDGISTADGEISTGGNPTYNESETRQATFPELDSILEEMAVGENHADNRQWAENPDEGPWTIDGTESQGPFEDGVYYADGIHLEDDLHFDLGSGNATVIVDGDIDTNGHDIQVVNWSGNERPLHALRIYTTGDAIITGDVNTVTENTTAFQLYGSSETFVGFHGTDFYGATIAPSHEYYGGPPDGFAQACDEDHQVCGQGNVYYVGVIAAYSVHFQSSDVTFIYDDALAVEDPDPYPSGYSAPPRVTFLNVVKHEIDIENA